MEKKEEKKDSAVAKKEPTMAERFTSKVIANFGSSTGDLALTRFQGRLIQNYFMAIDATLKKAEEKRLNKDEKYREKLPYSWSNVNLEQLSRDVVAAARIGWDPAQRNHIALIPFKNNAMNKYDIGFLPEYRGVELKAMKYGMDIPDSITVEVVCETDKFKSHKKDMNNKLETYEFEIVNDFDRGQIVGGFYYHAWKANPEKNKLVVMTMRDIEKRKPKYASVEFWGGEKDIWKDKKKTGEKEVVEGWYEQMVWKTIFRAAYGSITIDSQKIDTDYLQLKKAEDAFSETSIIEGIIEQANTGEVLDIQTGEITESPQSEESQKAEEPAKSETPGPSF